MIKHRWRDVLAAGALLALAAVAAGGCGLRGEPSLPANAPASQVDPAPTPTVSPPSATPLPSPSPIPTAAPTAESIRGAACLQGAWTLEDVDAYFAEALRASGNPAQLKGVGGSLTYRFEAGSRLEISFAEFFVTLNAPVEGGVMVTRSSLDGSASAEYRSTNDNELVLSDFSGDGVLFVIEVDGQILVQTALPAWASFFAALSQASGEPVPGLEPPKEVRATYDCAGDSLRLQGAGLPVAMVMIRAH